MKNFVSLFVMLLVCIGCWIPVASAQDNVVFADNQVRSAVDSVLRRLQIKASGPITRIHMADPLFIELDLGDPAPPIPEPSISDLGGLEYATNLQRLTIWYQDVRDFTPLENLQNFKALNLDGKGISDFTPFRNLQDLETLTVANSDIRAIPPLGHLSKLKALLLTGNNLGDNIKGLSTLTTLTELDIGFTGVRDIAPLRGLTNLEKLIAPNNVITDISPLRNLENLEKLDLRNNQIRDISPLQGTTALYEVLLEGNQIRDLSSLEEWNEETRFKTFSSWAIRFSTQRSDEEGTNPLSYPSIYEYFPNLIERYGYPKLYHNAIWDNVPYENVYYVYRVPTTLEIVSGDGQTVGPGEALPVPLIVKVLDENGDRFAGVPVTFEVTAGEGTVEPAMAVGVIPTDAFEDATEGEARTTFTAGTVIGPQTVVATVTHEGARVYDLINDGVMVRAVLREEREGATTLQTTFTINVQPGAIETPTLATVDPPPTHNAAGGVDCTVVSRARLRTALPAKGQRGLDICRLRGNRDALHAPRLNPRHRL